MYEVVSTGVVEEPLLKIFVLFIGRTRYRRQFLDPVDQPLKLLAFRSSASSHSQRNYGCRAFENPNQVGTHGSFSRFPICSAKIFVIRENGSVKQGGDWRLFAIFGLS